MSGDLTRPRHSPDAHAVVTQAERHLADRAGITASEASNRIRLYARFQDMHLVHVCQGILDGTIRLLTIRESERPSSRTQTT